MRKTEVVNLKVEAFDVYIGRGSNWGNPFIIGSDGSRDEVIAKYRDLNALRGKRLGCFCKPANCHGDVLIELLDLMYSKKPLAKPMCTHAGVVSQDECPYCIEGQDDG